MGLFLGNSIRDGLGYRIGYCNQHGTQQQCSSWMNILKNKQLRDDIQDNGDRDQIPNRGKCTSQRSSLQLPWNARADKKAGRPPCASLLPSRMPTSDAATGCKINRKRPAPESRATTSSKKRCVNRYRWPVCTIL